MEKIKKIFILVFIIVLGSCGQKPKISMIHKFDNNSWNAFKNVELKTTINDKEHPYKVVLRVQLTDGFEPQYFTIGLTQANEDGESIYSNRNLPIKNKRGKMLEKKNGDYYNYSLILNKKVYFNSLSQYTFTLESIMGKANIKGIHQIEIEISQL